MSYKILLFSLLLSFISCSSYEVIPQYDGRLQETFLLVKPNQKAWTQEEIQECLDKPLFKYTHHHQSKVFKRALQMIEHGEEGIVSSTTPMPLGDRM